MPSPAESTTAFRSTRMLRDLLVLASTFLLVLLATAPVLGQDMADDDLSAALSRFQERMANEDLEGAIADLEAVRSSRSDSPAQLNAILGALYAEVGRSGEALELLGPIADEPGANPAVLFNAGRAAMDIGDAQRADRYLTRAVRIAPASPAARQLGLLRGQLGETAQSYALLKRWVSENPDDAEARIAAAAGAVQLRRPLEAERLLAELPQQEVGVRFLWGRTLLQKGDPYGAIGYLEALVVDAPEVMQNDVRGSLVEAYNMIGDSTKALALLEGTSTEEPKMALNLAVAQYRNGALQDALGTLRPIAESMLSNPQYRDELEPSLLRSIPLEYGRMLLNSDKAEDAVQYLEAAVTADPNSRMAWQNLGQALAATGDTERAQQALQRFQQLAQGGMQQEGDAERDLEDPTGKALWDAMADLERDPDNALRRIRAEAAISPQDPRPGLFEARALLLLSQPQEALLIAQDLAVLLKEKGPLEADALYLVGSAQIAIDQSDAAMVTLRQALTVSPDHTGAMSDLAVVLMSKNQDDEAIRLLEKVLELSPGDPIATQNLEILNARS